MLDLVEIDPAVHAEFGYDMPVLGPDGSKTDAVIRVRGENSPAVKNHSRRIFQEFKVKEQQAKRRGREVEDITLEEAEEMAAESAAVRIINWTKIGAKGVELECNDSNKKDIMQKYAFLREQVMEASNNIFHFSKS